MGLVSWSSSPADRLIHVEAAKKEFLAMADVGAYSQYGGASLSQTG